MGAAVSSIHSVSDLKEAASKLPYADKCITVNKSQDGETKKKEEYLTPEEMEAKRLRDIEEAAERRKKSISHTGFKGDWVDERKHGKGHFTYEDGATFDGEWQKDRAHGIGTYKTKTSVYVGEWTEDLKHGAGKETYIILEEQGGGSIVYEGQFSQGHRHGKGSLSWADGATYDGEFSQNNIEGVGTFKWKSGQKYSGQVSENNIHGAGRYEWSDGTYYEGQYKMGMKDGDGGFHLKTGNTMKCHWKDGKPWGSVVFRAKELAPPILDWYDGIMVAWATRSEDGSPRDADGKPNSSFVSSAAGLFSSRKIKSNASSAAPSPRAGK